MGPVTVLLEAWTRGDRKALDELLPLVYTELRRIARGYVNRRAPDPLLQPTVLINEAFVRLLGNQCIQWKNRAHFFGVAAKTMRGVLIDEARKANTAKRGGQAVTLSYDDAIGLPGRGSVDLLALDDALRGLAAVDPDLVELVELRFFGGLTIEEAAEVLGVSAGTVKRSWKTARSWLRREMSRR